MREYIIKYEYLGTLELEGLTLEDVRCVYEDDVYSNKMMKGEFIFNELFPGFDRVSRPGSPFKFNDKSGRIIEGKLHGFTDEFEYNDKKLTLSFRAKTYVQSLLFNDSKPSKLMIKYNIPYIETLTRELQYSYGLYEDFIFRFRSDSKKILINDKTFKFFSKVYATKYEKPDSILRNELYLMIEMPYDYSTEFIDILNETEEIVHEIMLILSLVFYNRMNSYGYYAELQEAEGKMSEFLTYKDSSRRQGKDYLKTSNYLFDQYTKEEKLSQLIETYVNKEMHEKKRIKRLIHSFISVEEINIFEAKFLSSYSLLESISKYIVNPHARTESEKLIKKAIEITKVKYEDLRISRHRAIKSSKNEWEITEYRDELVHFNGLEFEYEDMYKEHEKIMLLNRRMLLWILVPELCEWPYPNNYH